MKFLSSFNLKVIPLIAVILISTNPPGASQSKQDERVAPVVSAEWLQQNISQPGIIVMHVTTTKGDYENGHIPGACFLWPGHFIISTETESTIPAPADKAAKKLKELGVNNDSHVILYGIYGNLVQVCRIFVTLEHYGLRGRVSILNGGFEAWKNAGYESSTTDPVHVRGKFRYSVYENLAGWEFVRSALNNTNYTIIDARPKNQYDGTTGTSRAGHIPGAKNLPQADMYDSKSFMFIEAGKIRNSFEKISIPTGSIPIFYCNTGNSASILYVASIIAGYEPTLYDGSMEEWGSHFDWPVEKGD
jgi:thiosulfate/3-mercaptopyruvate sulfurtransferase